MCAVSIVHDFGRTIPLQEWTPQRLDDYKILIEKIESIDRKLGTPDCEDPEKAKFLKSIEKRLRKVEEVLGGLG